MDDLILHDIPRLSSPRMLLGFTGWMDAGRVSTGTVEHLVNHLGARSFAEIDSMEFYILNFPVATIPVTVVLDGEKTQISSIDPMEFTAIFRPHTKIQDGVIRELQCPRNEFYYSEDPDVILFHGEEPHIRWRAYADCILEVAERVGVTEMYFVGSVASPIPHTREPRVRASGASEGLVAMLAERGARLTDYEGPAGLVTFLCQYAQERGIELGVLVVEVPHYPSLELHTYPRSILRALCEIEPLLGVVTDRSGIEGLDRRAQRQLAKVMAKSEELQELVERLEAAYDREEAGVTDEVLRRLVDGIDAQGGGEQN